MRKIRSLGGTASYYVLLTYLILMLSACAGNVVSSLPEKPKTGDKYIFFLHGSVEETEGRNDKYEAAVKAIASGSATVISEIRTETDPASYARKLTMQINDLTRHGVPAKNITISGYSKGAVIALLAASFSRNEEINYVLLSGCSGELNNKYGVEINKVNGRILSIFDADDIKFGSCYGILENSEKLSFKEIQLNTGKGHNLFRIPKDKFIELWRDPLLQWAGA